MQQEFNTPLGDALCADFGEITYRKQSWFPLLILIAIIILYFTIRSL